MNNALIVWLLQPSDRQTVSRLPVYIAQMHILQSRRLANRYCSFVASKLARLMKSMLEVHFLIRARLFIAGVGYGLDNKIAAIPGWRFCSAPNYTTALILMR
jgi:hypothetical protein